MSTTRPEKRTHFQLKRLGGLLKVLLTNKMAAVGLVFLLGSITVAVTAPLLTPYDPISSGLSGPFAEPAWVMNFPDGYRLSQNIVVVNDPHFNSPASVQAWNIAASPSTLSNLAVTYAPGVTPAPSSKGSLQIAYTGTGPATVIVSRTFHYPYHGPPSSFLATIQAMAQGVSASQPVHVAFSIDRVGDQLFTLWSQNLTTSGQWGQAPSLDSGAATVAGAVGTQGSILDPAKVIFSSLQDYSYEVAVTFSGPQTVNLDEMQLNLLGTAWGLLGTDYIGSDVWTQLVYGTRISLLVGLTAAALGIGLGLIIGLVAGFIGSYVDEVLMRFTDMILVIPYLPLLIVLVAVLGASIYNIILVIGLFSWMGFARVIRSQVLTLKERPFVEAARAAGAGPGRIMRTHVFPNIVSLTYVNLALTVPGAILTEAALEFLGLGDPGLISWGHMFFLAEESTALTTWWWVLPPGLAIAIVSISFILIGYALDEIFNPKLRRRR